MCLTRSDDPGTILINSAHHTSGSLASTVHPRWASSFLGSRIARRTYNKPALTIADQITRLQAIGLAISNVAEAQRALRFIGYFRLKGYFLNFMPPQASGAPRQFNAGTTLKQVIDLYQFDRKLRVLVMDEIERLEVAIRAVICNELSLSHGPHWYLSQYENLFASSFDIYGFLSKLNQDARRSKDVFMRHYFNTYEIPWLPPSWVAAECLSFGKWSQLYEGLRVQKNAIARRFNLPSDVFGSWLHSLTVLRNICAHHGRVWNRHYAIQPRVLRAHASHFTNLNLFYTLAVIVRYMTQIVDSSSDFPARLKAVFRDHPAVSISQMGFPPGWANDPFWQP